MKRPMVAVLTLLLLAIRSRFTTRARLEAKNLILRQLLVVVSQKLRPDIFVMRPTQNWDGCDGARVCGCRIFGAFLSNERNATIARSTRTRRTLRHAGSGFLVGTANLLSGKLFDEAGEPLYLCGATKGGASALSLLCFAQPD